MHWLIQWTRDIASACIPETLWEKVYLILVFLFFLGWTLWLR